MVERRERVDHAAMELPPPLAQDLCHRCRHRPGHLVGPLAGERIEHVGDRDDPTSDRDPLCTQAPGDSLRRPNVRESTRFAP